MTSEFNVTTNPARASAPEALLEEIMAQVGVDGLVAAMRSPGLLAAVDQHAAMIRDSLHAAGREVDVLSLASYTRSVLAVLARCGHTIEDSSNVDWSRAGAHLLRLVAVCLLASEAEIV